jgi:outer membrane protein TolC
MRHNIFTAAVVFLIALTPLRLFAQTEAAESEGSPAALRLADLEQLALEGNPALRAQRLRYAAARTDIAQAGALPDAKVGFGYFAVPVETRLGPQQATLSFAQSFPWFGALGAEEDAASARARQRFAQLADARNRVIVDLRSSWYRLYVLDRSVELTRAHLELVRTLREIALTRYEAGTRPFSHVLRLDMELEELRTALRSLADDFAPLVGELRRLTGRPIDATELLLPDSLSLPEQPREADVLLRAAEQANPRLRGLAEEAQYWRHRRDAARRMGYPMFTLGVTYTAIGPREDIDMPDNGRDAIIPQLGLSFPLFGSRYDAMAEQAQLQQQAADAAREDMRLSLGSAVQRGRSDLADAHRRFALAQRLAELSLHTWKVLLEEYSAGSAGIDEVLAVERDLLRHALDGEKARADANRAADELEYLTAQQEDQYDEYR